MKFNCKMFFHRFKCINNTAFSRALSTNKKQLKSSKSIRNEFLDYFTNDLNHNLIRSSPVMPLNDPSLPFVNAGMNQVKNNVYNVFQFSLFK